MSHEPSFGALASATVVPTAHGHGALRTAAAAGSHAAGRTAGEVPVATIAAELLALLTAALVARTESAAWPSGRLPNREFGNGTRRRLLPVRPRERGTNQRPMNRTVFFGLRAVGRSVGAVGAIGAAGR